ncbi:MAG TPA: EamA family transporter [Gemmatimonadales bacterium]|nr:EamA family transporter [Gemmatimonadales bacterium]
MSPRLRVVAAAVLFSTGGAAIKLCGFGSWQLAAGRAVVAACAMLVLIPEARRGWSWRSPIVGVAYAGAGLFFILANKLTTAASAIFIQATHPLFILALAPLLLHEHVRRRDLEYMALLVVGMALLLSAPGRRFATAPDPVLGNIFAAACAVCWALTVMGYRWVARRPGTTRGTDAVGDHGPVAAAAVTGNVMVFLIALPLAFPLAPGTPRDWVVVAYLGVFQLALAYVFLSRAVAAVRALEVSLVGLVEPVLSPVWAWLVHGETPGPRVFAGGAVILVATAWHAWRTPPTIPVPAPALEG